MLKLGLWSTHSFLCARLATCPPFPTTPHHLPSPLPTPPQHQDLQTAPQPSCPSLLLLTTPPTHTTTAHLLTAGPADRTADWSVVMARRKSPPSATSISLLHPIAAHLLRPPPGNAPTAPPHTTTAHLLTAGPANRTADWSVVMARRKSPPDTVPRVAITSGPSVTPSLSQMRLMRSLMTASCKGLNLACACVCMCVCVCKCVWGWALCVHSSLITILCGGLNLAGGLGGRGYVPQQAHFQRPRHKLTAQHRARATWGDWPHGAGDAARAASTHMPMHTHTHTHMHTHTHTHAHAHAHAHTRTRTRTRSRTRTPTHTAAGRAHPAPRPLPPEPAPAHLNLAQREARGSMMRLT